MPILRDRYGLKTTLVSAEGTLTDGFVKTQKNQSMIDKFRNLKKDKGLFTAAKRIDMSRPLNFYPAPNTYKIDPPENKKRSVSMTSTVERFYKSTPSN